MPRSRSHTIDAALLAAVEAHPRDLTRTVADQIGISRQAVAARLRVLVEDGFLARSGTTRPTYVMGVRREAQFKYRLAGLAEDRVWSGDVAPMLRTLPANIVDIAHHGLTELVDAQIPHMQRGTTVWMSIGIDSERTAKQVFDAYSSGPDERDECRRRRAADDSSRGGRA